MIDAVRSYLQLASGLAEMSAGKAKEAAAVLISQGAEATRTPEVFGGQVSGLAGDLLEQGKTNREVIVGLVKTEVDRAVGRMGFVREEELAAVRRHVQRLEGQLGAGPAQAVNVANTVAKTAGSTAKTAAQSAANAAKAAPLLGRSTPPKAAATASNAPAAKKAPAKKAPAKKAPAKKAPAKKAAAKRAPAKRTTSKRSAK